MVVVAVLVLPPLSLVRSRLSVVVVDRSCLGRMSYLLLDGEGRVSYLRRTETYILLGRSLSRDKQSSHLLMQKSALQLSRFAISFVL